MKRKHFINAFRIIIESAIEDGTIREEVGKFLCRITDDAVYESDKKIKMQTITSWKAYESDTFRYLDD